jgi:hypothetical protein
MAERDRTPNSAELGKLNWAKSAGGAAICLNSGEGLVAGAAQIPETTIKLVTNAINIRKRLNIFSPSLWDLRHGSTKRFRIAGNSMIAFSIADV